MLTLESVDVEIQNSAILRAVTLGVAPGELVCLVGRNGAGKTTTFRSPRHRVFARGKRSVR